MRRWLALGAVGLAVAWGPYLYSELARHPAEAPAPSRIESASLFDDGPHGPHGPPSPQSPPPTAAVERFESQTAAASEPAPAPARAVAEPPPTPSINPEPEPEAPPPPPPPPPPAETADKAAATPVDPAGLPLALAPAFRAEFDGQERDESWATDEEPRIQKAVSEVGVPDGVISEVTCHKTVCRALFASLELDKDIELKLYARLREAYGPKVTLEVRDFEGGGKAALYLLRPGATIDSPPTAANEQR